MTIQRDRSRKGIYPIASLNKMTVGLYKPSCGLSFLRRRNPIEIWIGFLLRRMTSIHSFYILKQFEVYTNRQSF
jgi:hypothetical protein